MAYVGHVKEGVVVFEGTKRPPEGVTVRVEELPTQEPTLGAGLDRLAGKALGLPKDLAERHDEYDRKRLAK